MLPECIPTKPQPRSQGPLLLGHGGRVGEDPGIEVDET